MSEEQIQKYRLFALKFIENNKNDLYKIYLEHSKTDIYGILLINISEVELKNNVNVSYVPIDILDIDIAEKINERKIQNDDNIIYIFLITPVEEQIIEIDIRSFIN
jgi:hypothetical protein